MKEAEIDITCNSRNPVSNNQEDNASLIFHQKCVKACQNTKNNEEEACNYLKLASEKGFNKWNILAKRVAFDRVRKYACYKAITSRK